MEQRLQKIISASGMYSRRRADDLIAQGRVLVNGTRAVVGQKADPDKDKIIVDSQELIVQKKVYYLLNKPKEYIVAMIDPQRRRTIYDLPSVRNIRENLMHVGRLDYMTEGLLILTNDGDFANLIMHPRYEKEKTYVVRAEPAVSEWDLARMRKGMRIGEIKISPAKVRTLKNRELEITIHEGMNRVIRKMLEFLGYKVFSLRRIKIGKVSVGRLGLGDVRPMTPEEVAGFTSKPSLQ